MKAYKSSVSKDLCVEKYTEKSWLLIKCWNDNEDIEFIGSSTYQMRKGSELHAGAVFMATLWALVYWRGRGGGLKVHKQLWSTSYFRLQGICKRIDKKESNWGVRCNNSRDARPIRNRRGYAALGFVEIQSERILALRIPSLSYSASSICCYCIGPLNCWKGAAFSILS